MYFGILTLKINEEVKVLHNLVIELTSKGLSIANLAFFVVITNKDLWKSRAIVENKLRTHTSLGPTFLGWQKAALMIAKWAR